MLHWGKRKREGGIKRRGRKKERTEDHASCNTTVIFKRMKKRDRGETLPCIYRNKTCDRMMSSFRTDRGWAQREQRDLGNKRWINAAPRSTTTTPTVDVTGRKTLEREVRRCSILLHHLLTHNSSLV